MISHDKHIRGGGSTLYPLSHKSLLWTLIVLHLVTISGCAVTKRVALPANEIPLGADYKITTTILKDGQIIEFDSKGGLYVEKRLEGVVHRVIAGTVHGEKVEMDSEEVLEVRFETTGTGGSFAGGVLLGTALGALGFYLLLVAAYGAH